MPAFARGLTCVASFVISVGGARVVKKRATQDQCADTSASVAECEHYYKEMQERSEGSWPSEGGTCMQASSCVARCQGPSWMANPDSLDSNFGDNVRYKEAFFLPGSLQELKQRLQSGRCFVPVGARHSWGQGVAPAGDSCEPVALEKMRGFSIDTCENTLTVEAGVRFKDVIPALQSRNLSLVNFGAVNVQTVVGAVMTSTHGSGQTPSVANSVIELKVIPASGDSVKVLTPGHDEEAKGWLNALGGLGFVVELKLALVPAFNFSMEYVFKSTHQELQALFQEQIGQAGTTPLDYSWAIYASESANTFEKRIKVDEPATGPIHPTTPIVDPILKVFSQSYFFQWFKGYPLCRSIIGIQQAFGLLPRQVHVATQALPGTAHEAHKHVELELFLQPEDLAQFLDVFQGKLRDCKQCEYFHVYPMVFRLIMPDSSKIWMSPFKDGPRISVSLFTYLELHNRDPAEALEPFTMFCDRVLHELLCNLNMSVTYHRGKYMHPEWIGAAELEEAYTEDWQHFKALRSQEDPASNVGSNYLETYSARMGAKYRACPTRVWG